MYMNGHVHFCTLMVHKHAIMKFLDYHVWDDSDPLAPHWKGTLLFGKEAFHGCALPTPGADDPGVWVPSSLREEEEGGSYLGAERGFPGPFVCHPGGESPQTLDQRGLTRSPSLGSPITATH